MSLVLNQFKPMIYSCLGKDATAAWNVSKSQTKELKKEYPDVRKDIQMAVYPIAGMYKALQNYITADEAKKIMLEYAPTIGNKLRKKE